MAFYAPATCEVTVRLGGGVTGKRVAARQRLAEDFWLGSVSVHFFNAEALKPEDVGTNSFLADGRESWKWFSGPLQFKLKVVPPLRKLKLKLKVVSRPHKLERQELSRQ